MRKAPATQIRSPKVVLDDIIQFSDHKGKCRFVPMGSPDKYLDFDFWLINAVYDSKGKPLKKGVSTPLELKGEDKGLQVAFSNQVTYNGERQDALEFNLEGGQVSVDGVPSNTLLLESSYVKAVYDRSGQQIWENMEPI